MATVIRVVLVAVVCVFAAMQSPAQHKQNPASNVTVINPGDTPQQIISKAAHVVPASRQWEWQQRECIAFIHFGMNTFTNREWGEGTEPESLFNPTDLDARQWAKGIRDAGFKAIIITAKHHDGFCLWPSAYTEHSVKNSPWRNGKGDVVGDLAAACREFGLKFGVYLSPWDRHEPTYGDSPKYNEHFRNQLRELLTNYGEVCEVWFDGANGEGPNGKRQVYDWPSYYKVIRELQPGAVIFGMGPDVRWVGTESGYGRETEWSIVPDVVANLDSVAAASSRSNAEGDFAAHGGAAQQALLDGAFIPGDLTAQDLGSRDRIMKAKSLIWYPAETDVSIRPGWFYHVNEDTLVKTPEKLVDIYYSSVGRNGVLLLNIPPDKRGRISDYDIASLTGMRKILSETFKTNLAKGAKVKASGSGPGQSARLVLDGDVGTYWSAPDGVEAAVLTFDLPKQSTFDIALLQENIRVGQRIEKFRLQTWNGHSWQQFAEGTTIGYKRLLRFPPVTTTRVRLLIDQSRTSPTLSNFGLYKTPTVTTAGAAR